MAEQGCVCGGGEELYVSGGTLQRTLPCILLRLRALSFLFSQSSHRTHARTCVGGGGEGRIV